MHRHKSRKIPGTITCALASAANFRIRQSLTTKAAILAGRGHVEYVLLRGCKSRWHTLLPGWGVLVEPPLIGRNSVMA